MRSTLTAILIAVSAASCGGSSSSTAPTPTPPGPTTFSLSGTVTDGSTGAGINGATVTIQDGPNANRSALTDGSGHYTFGSLEQSGFTARATAAFYNPLSKGVGLTSNQVADFSLAPVPPFSASGSGDTVFEMPTTVKKIHIHGHYSGSSSNFIVHIAGDHVVNEIIGTCCGNVPDFDGTYLTSGGTVEILFSSGVQWTFTEVR
jgi:hypothetical protein